MTAASNASGGNFTYGGVISNTNGGANSVGLKKLGTNTLTLTQTNTYTGATHITGSAVVSFNNIGAFGSTSGFLLNGGTLNYSEIGTASAALTQHITLGGNNGIIRVSVVATGLDPAIIDVSPYWRPAAYADAVIVVDHARARQAEKRGSGVANLDLDAPEAQRVEAIDDAAQVLAVDAAVRRLEAIDPRLAQVVVWRYFAGLEESEIAAAMDVTERTVRRDWVKARTLLADLLGDLS